MKRFKRGKKDLNCDKEDGNPETGLKFRRLNIDYIAIEGGSLGTANMILSKCQGFRHFRFDKYEKFCSKMNLPTVQIIDESSARIESNKENFTQQIDKELKPGRSILSR